MSCLQPQTFLSLEAYLQSELSSPVRHEYLAGQVFAMAGAGERHNRIALNLAVGLRMAARGGPCGVFLSDMKLRVESYDACYYPDVMLVCDPHDPDEYLKHKPCLLAEVLSPSTEATDRREKGRAYRSLPGLRYYLLVASDRPRVEYWQRTAAGDWEAAELEPGETLRVDCGGYRAALTLEQIYEDLRWAGEPANRS
jgi:Uma2 family endonuclease